MDGKTLSQASAMISTVIVVPLQMMDVVILVLMLRLAYSPRSHSGPVNLPQLLSCRPMVQTHLTVPVASQAVVSGISIQAVL